MSIFKWAAAGMLALLCTISAAAAGVIIDVDMTRQTMHVQTTTGESYDWAVSTAGRGYKTPNGVFSVESMQLMHHSRKYDNSPMPHSIFFHRGFAIHGTYAEKSLGRAASHGCVRLSRANAAALYALVKREGGARITLTGAPDPKQMLAVRDHKSVHLAAKPHPDAAKLAHQGGKAAPLAYAPSPKPKSLLQWLAEPGM